MGRKWWWQLLPTRRGYGRAGRWAAAAPLRDREHRVRQAKFPVVKTMDNFDVLAIPSLNRAMMLELVRSEFLLRRETCCRQRRRVRFTTAAALVNQLAEAQRGRSLSRILAL